MTHTATIHTATISGDEIAPLIARIENVLEDYSPDQIKVALLAMVIVLSEPDIETEKLRSVMSGLSYYLCLLLGPDAANPEDIN